MQKEVLLEGMAKIARQAGAAILEVYDRADFSIETKADDSPLTAADLAAHNIIIAALAELAPDIPVLSEESDEISFAERSSWTTYFLVDPLDGTKEFINRNGEFTVNIALIEHHKPVLGAVYVPVQDKLYLGNVETLEARRETVDGSEPIRIRQVKDQNITVVASRRHGSDALVSLMANLAQRFDVATENVGSSLKFCLIAEGEADLYPRFAPTSEWDTGAAQALVVAAGGQVVNLDFEPLDYNAKENILNPHFVVFGDPSVDWQAIIAESNISEP
ncbi:MAG: 3'(2'), 5'-bisphosphate nucleotidase [Candidatus Azotimanducaceae bacterium]|jgi:3'(2'), 5'-bisphosphate nucleotidase